MRRDLVGVKTVRVGAGLGRVGVEKNDADEKEGRSTMSRAHYGSTWMPKYVSFLLTPSHLGVLPH